MLHNTRKDHPQADREIGDTNKYLDYPESGISPQQHTPQAALGPPAAAAAGPPAAAAAAPAGGILLLSLSLSLSLDVIDINNDNSNKRKKNKIA